MNKTDKEFFSNDFTNFFIKNIGGYVTPEKVETFLAKLQSDLSKYHYDKNSESNLIRLTGAQFDKTSFVNDSIKFPHHLEIVSAIVCNSNFLTDIIVQNPEYLYQVFDNNYLLKDLTPEFLDQEIRSNLDKFKSFNAKLNYLRQFKKRIILKIGISDILGFTDLTQTTSHLTYLASSILSVLFELCYNEISTKYDIILPENFYCLSSLGKHGGNELNYSSDVDLILFYEKDYIPSKLINKEYVEFLNEAVLLFIKSSSDLTPKGYIYRVDFRLRPDGKHSPLCRTITDYMRYYEARGENWERQMLIKLNYICGGKELYNSFYNYLRGFIFPSSYQHSMKEQVKKIKIDIERKVGTAENVKLFSGGIRDIEFSVQVLQLLNGSRIKELRNGNTLESIELLLKNDLLHKEEAEQLKEAYIFYRNTEHFLQLMNDLQTHLIPGDTELLNKLARYHKLKDIDHFKEKINRYRKDVKKFFLQVIGPASTVRKKYLPDINFSDEPRAAKNLKFLQNGSGLLSEKEFNTGTIENFKTVEPAIIRYLAKSSAPDRILENFAKVIKASRIPNLWYNQFLNRYFLKTFLLLCEYSQRSIDLISSNARAEDYYLAGSCFAIPDETEITTAGTHNIILTLSVLLALKKINGKSFSALLSRHIDSNIVHLSEKFQFGFFIAALGTYGTSEMNFASDIDFIMVIDDSADIYKAEILYEGLVQTLSRNIPLFDVDLRLRPEGKSSQLIRQMKSYRTYLNDRARIWEFQALSKLRFVGGNRKLFNSFTRMITDRVKLLNREQIRQDIIEMHKSLTKTGMLLDDESIDLKKSKGGFATIEFAVQFLLLTNPEFYKRCLGKSALNTLKYLAGNTGYTKDFETLLVNYKLLKSLLLFTQNYNSSNNYKYQMDNEGLANSVRTNKLVSGDIGKQINTTMRENIIIFERITAE